MCRHLTGTVETFQTNTLSKAGVVVNFMRQLAWVTGAQILG